METSNLRRLNIPDCTIQNSILMQAEVSEEDNVDKNGGNGAAAVFGESSTETRPMCGVRCAYSSA
jgi:hypothetical protein